MKKLLPTDKLITLSLPECADAYASALSNITRLLEKNCDGVAPYEQWGGDECLMWDLFLAFNSQMKIDDEEAKEEPIEMQLESRENIQERKDEWMEYVKTGRN